MKMKKLSPRAAFSICIGITVTLILLTRILTIAHNMYLHPDEGVFFRSTQRLVNYLLGTSSSYDPVKKYPEGTFIFHAPFQMLFRLFSMTDRQGIQLSGRAASIFYFSIGVVLGFLLLRRWFGSCLRISVIYGLTMVFSLFHLEQSRYGTSDPLSFMLLMLTLLLSSLIYEQKGNRFILLILEGIVCGFLASLKYTLLYFCLFPLFAAIRTSKSVSEKIVAAELVLLFTAAGFFMTSPKTLSDISFISQTIDSEWTSYLVDGNPTEVGEWHNHLLSVLIYMTVYSGLLGGPLLAVPLFNKKTESKTNVTVLWKIEIPLIVFGFFLINIFSKTLFMRSFYLLACIIDLYASAGLSRIMGSSINNKKRKWISIALLVITFMRGAYFFTLLTDNSSDAVLQQAIQNTEGEDWAHTTILGPGRVYLLNFNKEDLKDLREIDLDNGAFNAPESLLLRPGEMVITGTLDYSKCAPYFFPISNQRAIKRIDRWQKYKTINSEYLRFRIYPEWWYHLFGFWIKGSTGTDYEFPTNYIFYRPQNP